MRFGYLVAAAAAIACAAPVAAAEYEVLEVEPNDSIATAQRLPGGVGDGFQVFGTTEGSGFEYVDFYRLAFDTSFCQPFVDRCYLITVVTGARAGSPYITLFNPDGVDVFAGRDIQEFQIASNRAGPWTIGVRRADAAASGAYSFSGSVAIWAPEPASWAMMIAGVGAIGGAARRRRSAPALAA